MPFPILRTPFVVLTEIIRLLEPNEIVTASLCSKNLNDLLRNHYQRNKPLKWRLFMSYHDSYGVVGIAKCKIVNRAIVMVADHISKLNGEAHQMNEYRRGFSSDYPVLYTEDRILGMKMIVNYVSDLFNLDVYELMIGRNGIWAIDFINNRQEKMLGGVELSKNPNDSLNGDETVDYVLRNARASDDVLKNRPLRRKDWGRPETSPTEWTASLVGTTHIDRSFP
ncbi:unnamed protein product [Caenorhabditis nigoni]